MEALKQDTSKKTEDISALDKTPVKSNAVVKYSSVLMPAAFAQLRQNTDIKRPPNNWLSSWAERKGLNSTPVRSSKFSSFSLAHTFLDCVGDVNVVSDAENIKKLLKIPYSNKPVSMVVHRVENTLLIDEFDIHKHLLLRAENDWEWLRKYLLEHILSRLSSKDNSISFQERSKLLQKSLVSKFLHYSLASEESSDDEPPVPAPHLQVPSGGPILPEPTIEDELPSASCDRTFNRNVVWTFEDIQMLLGTDMPIFGGPSRPCISLRLRDARKPISVLTGIDYWLDNLMSNVPEVVMCYHVDGIVQKYEILKTEDLPYLNESKFSPSIIRDVAQNILSFLKANATKAGHTYWLFKGMNDDVVKLYDLTSLCSDSMNDKYENPFTIPVAMLLYRVARNMKSQSSEKTRSSTLRTLLRNCLKLLPKERYPQIVTSVHFMLAELYIPPGTDPSDPDDILTCQELNDWEPPEMSDDDAELAISELSVKSPYIRKKAGEPLKRESPPPSKTSLEDRCRQSLFHVQEGLNCLRFFNDPNKPRNNGLPDKRSNLPEDSLRMAKPNEPIPMPFTEPESQIKKSGKKKKGKKKQGMKEEESDLSFNCIGCEESDDSLKTVLRTSYDTTMPTWQTPENNDNDTWKRHLEKLLLKQACIVYAILYEWEVRKDPRGFRTLNFVRRSLKCCGENRGFAAAMLRRAGTSLLTIVNYLDERQRAGSDEPEDEEMDGESYPEVEPPSVDSTTLEYIDLVTVKSRSILDAKQRTVKCFEKSFSLVRCSVTYRNLGTAFFLLGVHYLNICEKIVNSTFDEKEFQTNFNFSEEYFTKSHDIFKKTNEMTFPVLGNLGKLYRIRAVVGGPNAMTAETTRFFQKAFDCFSKAIDSAKNVNSALLEHIEFDYATTWLAYAERRHTMVISMKNCEKLEDVAKESINVIQKAIKAIESLTSANSDLHQNHLGSLFLFLGNICFIMTNVKMNEKLYLQLSSSHFLKARVIFENLKKPIQVLTVQNCLIKLSMQPIENHVSVNTRKKHLATALEHLAYCKESLVQINEEMSSDRTSNDMLVTLQTLANALLKEITKMYKDKDQRRFAAFRVAYDFSLKNPESEPLASHLNKLVDTLPKVTLN